MKARVLNSKSKHFATNIQAAQLAISIVFDKLIQKTKGK